VATVVWDSRPGGRSVSEKFIIDLDHHSAELRDHNDELVQRLHGTGCPMGWSEAHGGFWAIWGYDALYDAVQDAETFSSSLPKHVPDMQYTSPLIPIDIDGPIQQEYRKLVLNWFNPGHAKAMQPRIQQICDELIDNFIERGEADLAHELFTALPAKVTLEMLDWDSDRWPEWVEWIHSFIHDGHINPEKAIESTNAAYAAVQDQIDRRRAGYRDDLFSDIMKAQVHGESLSDREVIDFAMLVLLGGLDTTSGVTGNTLLRIDRDPKLRQQLIEEIDYIPKAIEEFLRHDGPGGGLYRRLTLDCDFHGQPMKEGDRVLMMFWAANRDPNAFPDPERIDIHRQNNRHTTFGLGPHRCLGSHHGRLMFATMLREVMTRLPDFQVDWENMRRFEDCGGVYGVRDLPVTFTPGKRTKPIA